MEQHKRFFTLLGKEFSDGASYGLGLMLKYHQDNIITLPESVLNEIKLQISVADKVSDELHEKHLQEIRNKTL